MMYGFPIPLSTSHFVLKVNDQYASNYSGLGGRAAYMTTTRTVKHTDALTFTEMAYHYKGVRVIQRLIPVDKNFVEVDSTLTPKYFRIEYELKNIDTTATNTVGLLLLIDTMVDTNDASEMDSDGKRVNTETKYEGLAVPSQVYVYKTAGSLAEMTAEFITDKGKAVKPDELFIGRWPYFHSVVWDVTASGIKYSDSAVLMKWKEQALKGTQQRIVATHYGLATRKNNKGQEVAATPGSGGLSLLTDEKFSNSLVGDTVYFSTAGTALDAASKKKIDEKLAQKDPKKVLGVIVEGYTDAQGDDEKNVGYSRGRANIVKQYLEKKGIASDKIIPKAYGETFADQSEVSQKDGNPNDRKAVVIIYAKE
jgi:outer membrane protein OmpA-like peptidoglycan-associated protein